MTEFKYDIAFSFLAEDEQLALQFADTVRDRFRVFIYSEQQLELGGKDGVVAFSKVFAAEARVVVVLHRQRWGQTKWTRVEEEAIRGRAFQDGWDFALFIPLDEKPDLPAWFPKTRLYLGLKRWGLEGACGVIEQRVMESGGVPATQTIEDVAAKKQREQQREEARANFRGQPGVDWGRSQCEGLKGVVEDITSRIAGMRLAIDVRDPGRVVVRSPTGPRLLVMWQQSYSNTLDGAHLLIRLWDRPPDPMSEAVHGKAQLLAERRYVPDLGLDGRPSWMDEEKRSHALSDIVENAMMELLEAAPGQ